MTIEIRCNYCKKTVPYYGKLYRILRVTKNRNRMLYDDYYRYCSEECAKKQTEKENINEVEN